jgi:hypothetical protein
MKLEEGPYARGKPLEAKGMHANEFTKKYNFRKMKHFLIFMHEIVCCIYNI